MVAAVAVGLVLWIALAFALAHNAEESLMPGAPLPWHAIALTALLVGIALIVRPLAGAVLGGTACIALIAAAAADARTGYLFDAVTLPAALLVGALAVASGRGESAAWGVAILVGAFGSIVLISRGRWMGLGDVKALYAVGAAFGPLESLIALFAACVSGIIAAAFAGRFCRGAQIRFGPHLAAGAAFALLAGEPIVHRWMGL